VVIAALLGVVSLIALTTPAQAAVGQHNGAVPLSVPQGAAPSAEAGRLLGPEGKKCQENAAHTKKACVETLPASHADLVRQCGLRPMVGD
jgi:hypothetical protein